MALSLLQRKKPHLKGKINGTRNGPIPQYCNLLSSSLLCGTLAIGTKTNFIFNVSTQESEHEQAIKYLLITNNILNC